MRFCHVNLYETEHHVRMIRIVVVPVFGWFDDVVTDIGVCFLKYV